MLKQNWRLVSRIERLGDTLIIIACFFFAYYGRNSLLFWDSQFALGIPFEGPSLAPLKDYGIVLFIALTSYTVLLNWFGAYSSMRFSTPLHLLGLSIVTSVLVFFFLAAVLFTIKIDLSRSFIGLFCLLVALTLSAERYVALRILRFLRKSGKNFRNVIICGTGEQALRIASEISMRPELGIRIRGFSSLSDSPSDGAGLVKFRSELRSFPGGISRRIVRGIDALDKTLKDYAIDELIFTDVLEVMPAVQEMMFRCSEQGIRTTIAADLFSMGMVKSGISYFGSMPLIHFQTPPGDQWELGLKRVIDIFFAAVFLLLLAPLFFLIAVLVRVTSPGPVIYRQKRVGLNGRLFDLYKFRSMCVGAEEQLNELRQFNEMSGPVFKMSADPRVTKVGRFLRRFSLDELPQLYNVLRGDMSLVGPRPPIPGEVSLYERRDRRRLSMRPGLTCTWQVSGRNKINDFEYWVKLDLDYIDNWSLRRDFLLIFRTFPAVFFGNGAK
jgi:exopolysaccharide biosynthesis polyprenyl glycosylphosphotransferase